MLFVNLSVERTHEPCVPTDCGAKLQHFEMVLEVCGGLSWKCRFNVVFCGLLLCLFGHGMPCSYIAEYTLSLCTTQQQASSNLQASKQSRSESKNTQRECVFFAKRRRLFTTPKGRVNSQNYYTL